MEAVTHGAEFVNADELARERWPGFENQYVEDAARLAAKRRSELLEAGKTFVTETVFSHESKLAFVAEAKRRGFRVIIYHVHVTSVELAQARIRTRLTQGGHSVPDEKIEARFDRSLELIPRAAGLADMVFVFDNSERGRTHTHVMTLSEGQIIALREPVPEWVERAYRESITAHRATIR